MTELISVLCITGTGQAQFDNMMNTLAGRSFAVPSTLIHCTSVCVFHTEKIKEKKRAENGEAANKLRKE